jgi:hypothetical protein
MGQGGEVRRSEGGVTHGIVMPALVAGIHVLLSRIQEVVDGRDKPGHEPAMTTLMTVNGHFIGTTSE